MRMASISDLHNRTSELVREAEKGEVILIQRRGKTVAELHPAKRRQMPDMTEFWARGPSVPLDSGRILEEDRDRGNDI